MQPFFVLLLFTTLFIDDAAAYVGPGLGLGVIGVIVGVVVTVLLAILGLVWYPLKRLFKKGKPKKKQQDQESEG